jgi:DNA-binding transcriptional LysR family regulator
MISDPFSNIASHCRVELRQFRYFVAVAEQLHFGRAAARMNVVQAAISQQIKRLEKEIGTELFERSGTEVRLTEAGQQMLQQCRLLLAQAEQVHRVVKLVGAGEKGRLNFGFVDNAICGLLPPLVRAYRRLYPQVHITFQTLDRNQQIDALESHRLDLGLLPGPVLEPTLESESFVSSSLIAALPRGHALAGHSSLELEQLAREPFLLFSPGADSRFLELVLAACTDAGFVPDVVQEATHMHTLIALVQAGFGITLIPRWVALEGPDIVFRPVVCSAPPYELAFAWRRGHSNRTVDLFRECTQRLVRELQKPAVMAISK